MKLLNLESNSWEDFLSKELFHGSYTEIKKPEIRRNNRTKDFGFGFYCTVIKNQAERWSRRFSKPVVNCYKFYYNGELKIKYFETMTEEWLDLIISCRSNKNYKHDYDIIIGPMVDDKVYEYMSDYLEGRITREQFWVLARFKYPTNQIVFCIDKALSCLIFVKSEEV